MAVNFETSGKAAILRMNRPPVNAIAAELRQQLQAHLRAALSDPGIERIILTGSEKIFAAGADAAEFDARDVATDDMSQSHILMGRELFGSFRTTVGDSETGAGVFGAPSLTVVEESDVEKVVVG